MGIRLDWQAESEQSRLRATEDPAALRRRQRARRQIMLLLALLVAVLGLIGALILWRLQHVDDQIRRDLLDTVSVEVTALRVGDLANYMAVQRSASDSFLLEQSQRFEDYQTLKASHRVALTGEVISATIDNQRARVVLEESEYLRLQPHPQFDPLEFCDIAELAAVFRTQGHYGGLRLLQASCKRFFEACMARGVTPTWVPSLRRHADTSHSIVPAMAHEW